LEFGTWNLKFLYSLTSEMSGVGILVLLTPET
jgi:hypothetical protein